ncbi:hypothetical protein B0O99DRAFT_589597 [Bisporella sp. PMI_857]|nr:hypothetical protein B0O99DRAFT_589597 [Bisporella sp. PMI_857]
MAPIKTTEDYYFILEVAQTDTTATIRKSYRRLALLRHPDRNPGKNSTAAFQLLDEAYRILVNDVTRRDYDLLYPSIKKSKPASGSRNTKHPPPKQASSSASRSKTNETTQIAALQKAKKDREAEFAKSKLIIEGEIFQLRRTFNQLASTIRAFEEIERAEEAEEAVANSWSAWAFSPLFKRAVETPEEKQQKANDRLQRLHAKSFKQRSSVSTQAKLFECENKLREREQQLRVENSKDDAKIIRLEQSLRMKKEKEQQERQRAEREAAEKQWREYLEREKAEREAREKARKAQEEKERVEREARERARKAQEERERIERERKAEKERKARKAQEAKVAAEKEARDTKQREMARKARADQIERMRKEDELRGIFNKSYESSVSKEPIRDGSGHILYFPTTGSSHASASTRNGPILAVNACSHAGWWDKIHESGNCEDCGEYRRHYRLQCPSCEMKACPACQSILRTRSYPHSATPRKHRGSTTQPQSGKTHDEYYLNQHLYDI